MALQVFQAPDRKQAMIKMATALGPDAFIVSGQDTKNGFRLTATIGDEQADLSDLLVPARNDELDDILRWIVKFHRPIAHASAILLQGRNTKLSQIEPNLVGILQTFIKFAHLPNADRLVSTQIENEKSPTTGLRPIAMVGLPGSGKTACCARLALEARLAGCHPVVTSIDKSKTGGASQLKRLLAAMGVELSPSLDAISNYQPNIIDTAGVNPFSSKEMSSLADQIASMDAQPVLVFDAAVDAEDSMEIAREFTAIGVEHVIISRLDLCRRLGAVFSMAIQGLSLSGATVSPMIAKPIFPLTVGGLERILLRHRE